MKVNKNAEFRDFDEFLKTVQKLNDGKRVLTFNGQVHEDGNRFYTINWTSEEEV